MIIVTGANGFIGSAFVWQLNEQGFRDIICVDTVPRGAVDLLAGRSYARLLGKDDLWAFLATEAARQHVTAIVHMGACSSTTELDVDFLRENNTLYTQRIWEWCTLHKKTLIYASSAAVYGDGACGFDDSLPPATYTPLNPYGESKAAFDRWAVQQTAAPPVWFGLRFFNVFGPNEYYKGNMASVVFKAFNQIRATGQLQLFRSHRPDYRDGEQKRDFVYVKDITRWMGELLKLDGGSGIYNMGFGQARTWLDLAGATFSAMGVPQKIDWIDIPPEMRPRYQYFTEATMTRLLGLGLSPARWPLEAAVTDYVSTYLAPGPVRL